MVDLHIDLIRSPGCPFPHPISMAPGRRSSRATCLGEQLEQEANPATLKLWLRKTATVEPVDAFLGMVSR